MAFKSTRREVVVGLSAALLLNGRTGLAEEAKSELIALPDKAPLIKRTFRAPNYETPLEDLRSRFTANEKFFVRYHLANIPKVDARTWKLRVGGESAGAAREWSLEELKRDFERVSVVAINQCSGNRRGLFTPRVPGVQWEHGAIGNAKWTGVRLADVLKKVGVRADALEVVLDAADTGLLPKTPDYVKSLPIERALDEHTLIAFEMNDRPLPHWHGAPARLVVPGWTATYWIKHLTDIRVVSQPFDGFWMKNAYRLPKGVYGPAGFPSQERADTVPITDIVVNSLITSHRSGERLMRGQRAELSGWAWDNGAGIARVEVSLDGGRSWRSATLDRDSDRFGWRGFRWPLDTTKAGPLAVSVRATSRNGATQPAQVVPNGSGYHHNAIQTVLLEVA
jgi:DMSO/TMAO reductase YedYZ molybdopterin-dependent catalytic subunit